MKAVFFLALIAVINTEGYYPGITTNALISENLLNDDTMLINYHPIGEFHTGMTPQSGAPRQGILEPGTTGSIEIYTEYRDALRDMDKCEYIIVIYHLNKSKGWHSFVTPPGSDRSFGLFATRSPNRPNPIGLGIVKLDSISGCTLSVSGIDAFDGTPVLDIKPWLPSIDCPSMNKSTLERDLGIRNK
jgi:tRNA-Thr(GGU) m(6)t(6)A37 methyltransferase TsaA